MARAFSKRVVLRAGYAAVIAVLILSAGEAYRIQVTVSQQHLEIYRHYVSQDAALNTLRRNLWLAGNYARDFFIDTTPAQAETLHAQVEALKQECEQALEQIVQSRNAVDVLPSLRKSMGEF